MIRIVNGPAGGLETAIVDLTSDVILIAVGLEKIQERLRKSGLTPAGVRKTLQKLSGKGACPFLVQTDYEKVENA